MSWYTLLILNKRCAIEPFKIVNVCWYNTFWGNEFDRFRSVLPGDMCIGGDFNCSTSEARFSNWSFQTSSRLAVKWKLMRRNWVRARTTATEVVEGPWRAKSTERVRGRLHGLSVCLTNIVVSLRGAWSKMDLSPRLFAWPLENSTNYYPQYYIVLKSANRVILHKLREHKDSWIPVKASPYC